MNRIAEPRGTFDLKEAIREIHLMAGFDQKGLQEADPKPFAIGITSPTFGDGKTTVAMALAGSLSADFGTEVTLVDADFHTHSVAQEFGLAESGGLAEVLTGSIGLREVTHRVSRTQMNVVPAGATPADPARLARSEHLGTLIENIKRTSRYVIIDLPAALHSMNGPVLAKRCDGVIVVVRAGHTLEKDLERVLHLLRDANVLGVVVNRKANSVPGWVQNLLNVRK